MFTYIIRRILISIPLLFGISLLTFVLMQATPGNFFDTLKLDPQVSPETIARYERLYHLDKPILQQYFYWLKNLLRGDLGYSFFYNCPVDGIIKSRLLNTFILAFAGLMVTWTLAIPLGILAALHRNKWIDRLLSFLSFCGLSMPSFFLAMILLFWASTAGALPLGGIHSVQYENLNGFEKFIDLLKHLVIPTIAISLASVASLMRIMRGNMLDVLRQQYILAARAKGLPEQKIVYKHALRNAINPLITIFGYHLSDLLSGAALIEIICNWPGMGSLMLTAVRAKDVHMVMANVLLSGILLLVGNLLADIFLASSDPRIRYDH